MVDNLLKEIQQRDLLTQKSECHATFRNKYNKKIYYHIDLSERQLSEINTTNRVISTEISIIGNLLN